MDRFLDRPGARLAYDVQDGDGERPVVVALHGMTASRAAEDGPGFFAWQPIAEDGRTLVRYDARGHGRSTGRPEPEDYRWPVLAEDLLALLDVVSPGAPVDAIGVSMGVGTLLHAATRVPHRFRRLVLALPPTAWSTRAAQGETYGASARFVEERGIDAFARGMAALPPLPILAAGGWTLPAPDVDGALLPAVMRGAALTDLPAGTAVEALQHEVLLRPWADDPGHPVSTAERLAGLLPNGTLEVMREPEDLRGLGARVAAFLS